MRIETRNDYEIRVEAAVRLLRSQLDAEREPTGLADHVGFSPFHFHRIFQAMTGETIGEMIRRLRLERAAYRLRSTSTRITVIAFEAGYATHEAFVRAFRQAFGYTPSWFRKRMTYQGELPTPNGVHYRDGDAFVLRFKPTQEEQKMNVEIREAPDRRAACMLHEGPYYMIGQTFAKVMPMLGQKGIPMENGIGIYYNDPSVTPPDQLRSHAGAIVPNDFPISESGFEVVDVPGGTFAVATHRGPYDGLSQAWMDFYGSWLPSSGYEAAMTPPFELYVNDCMKVAPEDVLTELWIAVKPGAENPTA